jgi:pullulanase
MKDTFLSARLVEADLIRLVVFSSVPFDKLETTLLIDRLQRVKLQTTRNISTSSVMIVDYHLTKPLPLGHSYVLILSSYGSVPLDVSEATSFPNFDKDYSYDGSDLGATYSSTSTSFALWAPLASSVTIKIRKFGEDEWFFYPMARGEKGVFKLVMKGDYEKASYLYLLTNNETVFEATDPYAKASAPNGKASIVVDFSKLKMDFHREALPVISSYTQAILYEANVRDLTIDKHTDIEHKGTFKGLTEKGRKTTGGLPAGFDYIVSLGITHLQLQPLYDFATVDELNPSNGYNWGYDPAQYFVPEGSYASDLTDPYSRIKELQEMVAAFHSSGVRIVTDVVFNHVYEYSTSVLEKIVPNYYFRRRYNGKMASTSGCGDDLASERPMVRKLIIDACRYWIETFGIDGFRFDLMGIIDVETLHEVREMARSIDPSFILYGEGWNMGGDVSFPLGQMGNYKLLPEYAFFNDRFRDPVRKYLTGDTSCKEAFEFAYVSSSVDFYYRPIFLSANQSINYIECHDNSSFFDYVSSSDENYSLKDKLEVCKLGLAVTLTSMGVPFIHMGQEIAQSKWGKDNTYNLGDLYNKFSYRLLDERKDMYEFFVSLIKIRKKFRFFSIYDPRVIDQALEVKDEGPLFIATIASENIAAPYEEVRFVYNFSSTPYSYKLTEERTLIFSSESSTEKNIIKVLEAKPHSFSVLAKMRLETK